MRSIRSTSPRSMVAAIFSPKALPFAGAVIGTSGESVDQCLASPSRILLSGGDAASVASYGRFSTCGETPPRTCRCLEWPGFQHVCGLFDFDGAFIEVPFEAVVDTHSRVAVESTWSKLKLVEASWKVLGAAMPGTATKPSESQATWGDLLELDRRGVWFGGHQQFQRPPCVRSDSTKARFSTGRRCLAHHASASP